MDDQAEWVDNHVIYGLSRSTSQSVADDVWEVPGDGMGEPAVLISRA